MSGNRLVVRLLSSVPSFISSPLPCFSSSSPLSRLSPSHLSFPLKSLSLFSYLFSFLFSVPPLVCSLCFSSLLSPLLFPLLCSLLISPLLISLFLPHPLVSLNLISPAVYFLLLSLSLPLISSHLSSHFHLSLSLVSSVLLSFTPSSLSFVFRVLLSPLSFLSTLVRSGEHVDSNHFLLLLFNFSFTPSLSAILSAPDQ